jgi:cytosine/adenosine deaminase-related metal-dependent hydrolase
MVDLLIRNGLVVTVDGDRRVIDDGAVAVEGREIVAVGRTDEVSDHHDADRVIDADGMGVVPGFIDPHIHIDTLLRPAVGNGRSHEDFLFNVKRPGVAAMSVDDQLVSSALYCVEAIQSGVTTFAENASGTGPGYDRELIEAKFDLYESAGMRNVYAYTFADRRSSDVDTGEFVENIKSKTPGVNHPNIEYSDTEASLAELETLMGEYHGNAGGRQSVWPAPYITWAVSREGLERSLELAAEYDVMTTTHAAESAHQERHGLSSIDYLNNVGYLGERTLLHHCTYADDRDVRLLAATDTKVTHNPISNLTLGDGFAPVPEMVRSGVTVTLGTDNVSYSSTVNMLNDLRFAATVHKGYHHDAAVLTAEKVFEMVTVDGARAIGREDDLGSLEAGKLADLVLVDLDYPHLTPTPRGPDVVAALVYQAQGFEVDTVVCNGEVIMEDREVHGIAAEYPELLSKATERGRAVIERSGLDTLTGTWETNPNV